MSTKKIAAVHLWKKKVYYYIITRDGTEIQIN
jgi:hypothetical protein